MSNAGDGNLLGYIDVLTGGAFSNATIFAMSISPYITGSIVIQLLTVAIPALERMSKEGEDGRKRLNRITRYTGIGLGFVQALAYWFLLKIRAPWSTPRALLDFFSSGHHRDLYGRFRADCLFRAIRLMPRALATAFP